MKYIMAGTFDVVNEMTFSTEITAENRYGLQKCCSQPLITTLLLIEGLCKISTHFLCEEHVVIFTFVSIWGTYD